MEESSYVLHINFGEIKAELDRLQTADKELSGRISSFIICLNEATSRIEPTLKKETNNERELWEEYKKLQREKLAVLDLSHEWDYIGQSIKDTKSKAGFFG